MSEDVLPLGRGADPTLAWTEYRHFIEAAIMAQPRSRQQMIGPSELGGSCLRCLGRKLAGIPQKNEPAWLPALGTATHTWLEQIFSDLTSTPGPLAGRWLPEVRVNVGEVAGVAIWGTADLYDTTTAEVTDWKLVGATTLKAAKAKGPTPTYRAQAHLYGKGLVDAGHPVDSVRIVYLPRNAVSLDAAHAWVEPYDADVATGALARANALASALAVAGSEVIIPSLPAEAGCFSCPRYDGHVATPKISKALAALAGQ